MYVLYVHILHIQNRLTFVCLGPREQFPGQFVQFGPPPPPTNVGSARPKIFEHKTRQIITNPLLSSGLRPLYGLDEQGFPFWCFLLPLSELVGHTILEHWSE